jgi:hypothetical protein
MQRQPPKPPAVHPAEFVEALHLLHRGHWLVQVGDGLPGSTMIDGAPLWHSFDTLRHYALIDEVDNPEGFHGVRYFRLSAAGRRFAERALAAWRERPWWERLLLRLAA